MARALTSTCFISILSSTAFGQTVAKPAFEIADVRATQFPNRTVNGGVLRDGRYELRRATLLDLIVTAYGVDADTVVGGPSWLDWDRYDVIAKAPPSTSPETVKLMLQSLLADRFKLVVHKDTKPVPAFVLAVGKGKPKLKQADGSGDPGCHPLPQPAGPRRNSLYSCRNMTMQAFGQTLRQLDSGPPFNYLTSLVVDSTGLKGAWDFDLRWTPLLYLRSGSDGVTLFEAVDKQLGLTLELQQVPMPVIVVDKANQNPTANAASVTTSLPPPAGFEVASLRQSPPNAPPPSLEILPGGRVTMRGQFLRELIRWAWQDEVIVGLPKWLEPFRPAFDIIAKASSSADAPRFEIDDLRLMTRSLLVGRFKMVTHHEDRPTDAYTLVAEKPKLKKADPSNRAACKRGAWRIPGQPDEAPPLGSTFTCRNATMAQFAERLQGQSPELGSCPVLDATRLAGGWDFTLTWGGALGAGPGAGGSKGGPPEGGRGGGVVSDFAGVSLSDAVRKQLGLKLETHKRPLPVLVIDHMEEKPTEN